MFPLLPVVPVSLERLKTASPSYKVTDANINRVILNPYKGITVTIQTASMLPLIGIPPRYFRGYFLLKSIGAVERADASHVTISGDRPIQSRTASPTRRIEPRFCRSHSTPVR